MASKMYGKWQVLGSLGEGGQSHVFRVRSEDTGSTTFALKRLKNRSRLERFKQEIDALLELSDHRILKIRDYDVSSDSPFYVMPLIENGDMIRANVFDWPLSDRLNFFCSLLEAMATVHQHGIVHRDIKPQNILISDQRLPIVADFGICFVAGGQRYTHTEEVVGGPRVYAAPEVEAGNADEVDERSDVYSLGKVLYWILAGKDLPREWHRKNPHNLYENNNHPRYELVNRLLDRCVTEDTKKRYKNAGEMLSDYRLLLDDFDKVINIPSQDIRQRCVYCGLGEYELLAVGPDGLTNRPVVESKLGLHMYNSVQITLLRCRKCFNLQLFSPHQSSTPNPWRKPG